MAFSFALMYDQFLFLHTADLPMLPRLRPILFLFLCPTVFAHDFWLEQEGGDTWIVQQGHRYSTHGGAETVPYDPAKLGTAWCAGEAGRWKPLDIARTQPARLTGTCLALSVSHASGYWTKTPWGTHNEPKTGVSGVLKSWYSEESVKRLVRWHPALATPFGKGLELVPTVNPLTLKAGDKLVVQVLEEGKPVAGVPVAYGEDTRGASGDDGRIGIRLRHGGMQLIVASRETPLNDGKADVSIRTATLQFEIAP